MNVKETIKSVALILILASVLYDVYLMVNQKDHTEELIELKIQLDSIKVNQENYQSVLKATQDSLRLNRKVSMEIYEKIKLEANKNYRRYENTANYLDSLTASVGVLPDF
tara:strand:+ start:2070 stop:2399 length:330 start_codon:yes stop_codon:yes gene_type:complete